MSESASTIQQLYSRPKDTLAPRYLFRFLILIEILQISRVTLLMRRRDPGDFASIDFTNSLSIGLTLLTVLLLVANPSTQSSIRTVMRSSAVNLVLFYLFCGVSVIWSSSVAFGTYRTIEMISHIFVCGFLIMHSRSNYTAALLVMRMALLAAALHIAWYWFVLGDGISVLHSNAFPATAAMGAVFGLSLIAEGTYRTRQVIFLTAVLVGMMLLGTSGGSNVSFVIGVAATYLLLKPTIAIFIRVIIVLVVTYALYTGFADTIMTVLFPGKDAQQISTMTGRVGMWETYIDGFLKKPILGWGFPSGEKEANRFGFVITTSSHNSIISVAVNTGTVGVIIFFSAVWRVVSSSITRLKRERDILVPGLAALVAGASNSMTYPTIGSHWYFPTTIFLLVLMFCVLRRSTTSFMSTVGVAQPQRHPRSR